ncbi:MAG: hypothetical protein HQK77_17630 [Desulfobacterales bacterium]|nr:hypothetical protein [Desulfobacterales bacterium]
MNPAKYIGNNQNGSTLYMIVILMTLILSSGLFTLNTTNLNFEAATNERIYKQNLARAESAAMEAAQLLENKNQGDLTNISDDNWIVMQQTVCMTGWDDSNSVVSSFNPNTRYRAVALNPFVDDGNPNVYSYRIFGLYKTANEQILVEIGYKKMM